MDMLTTGEAAAVLQVSVETIRRYIDAGKLHGERLPMARSFRRVRREDLIAFAEQYKMTLDWEKLGK